LTRNFGKYFTFVQ